MERDNYLGRFVIIQSSLKYEFKIRIKVMFETGCERSVGNLQNTQKHYNFLRRCKNNRSRDYLGREKIH